MSLFEALLDHQASRLAYYSPFQLLLQLPNPEVRWQVERQQLLAFGTNPGEEYWLSEGGTRFLYRLLAWDTAFFGKPMARLRAVLVEENEPLSTALGQFTAHLSALGVRQCIMEVPAEDPRMLQALGQSGWMLIETRLQYAHEHLTHLNPVRYDVRCATTGEGDLIRNIARYNANPFDRFHADPFFTHAQADDFLEAYAGAALGGYCDEVLVPGEPDVPVDSFLAINYTELHGQALGIDVGRLVLMAVGAQNRGWSRKLFSEALYRAHERGTSAMLLTTQASNRAVMRNAEVLGFRLGAVTHIFSWNNQ
jgi:dTDP-4-amino-4,6-dideoxy-D-galactose acyltransferase